MEKPYFPMFIDISEKKIIVIGGGTIAARRVGTLTQFAADITVIAPAVTDSLKHLEMEGKINCLYREYKSGDIMAADIVLAATDNHELNYQIALETRETEEKSGRNILLSVANDRSWCDFYFPSVILKDEIVVGINSGGKNPGKVKQIRKKIEEELSNNT